MPGLWATGRSGQQHLMAKSYSKFRSFAARPASGEVKQTSNAAGEQRPCEGSQYFTQRLRRPPKEISRLPFPNLNLQVQSTVARLPAGVEPAGQMRTTFRDRPATAIPNL